MKVILAAGGSGGHIFPSVALAAELEKAGVTDVFFVSSKRRLDRNILGKEKQRCFFLSANPMPFKFNPIKYAVFIFKLLTDAVKSMYILIKIRPDAVVGFGGYSSGAIVLCAKLFGVPIVIHEQNLVPGRANMILGRIADRIAVSFKESAEYFQKEAHKAVFTGNPLRLGMLAGDRLGSAKRLGVSPEKKTVLVMGGSQGSTFLNSTVSKVASIMNSESEDEFQFIHLTGKRDYDAVKDFYVENGIKGRVFSFLDEIDDAYAVSDIAISRSGAAAVFELAYYSKPMVLVPYPNPRNNQRSNAIYFSRTDAAVYREESDLSPESLAKEVVGILSDTKRWDRASRAAGQLSVPEAGKKLAKEVMSLVTEKKGINSGEAV